VAINLKVIENEDAPVIDGGPDAYFATLPTRAMVAAMAQMGIPAQVTYSAGTFLCNHLMYSVLHHVASRKLDIKAGFIHVPPTPDLMVKRGGASMALSDIQRGVLAGLHAVVESLNKVVVKIV
jgi:pyroglutamyl-peptidase